MTKERLEKGLTQVYTGNGKGKTSAALGLALRAIGWGLKAHMIQFIKGGNFKHGELQIIKQLPDFETRAFGRGRYIKEQPPLEEDVKLAKEALRFARKIVNTGDYDIVILDEINVALHLKLIKTDEVIELIENKPRHVELILTGRYAPSEIIDAADLVTEMREVKHPYAQGILDRKGIEY
ncbi:MAG: cob(I)yrinic acid a,c-diamide adenosyltransferase [Candidatus Bathyarchaeota archaeon]|nr:cob(I)yrinic acid a,c-diamide adenosyltransferase [Candidatus Bathyarchaeota archaeon]MDH5596011.1 cob(I)yrinic acid a,c-diamide adenosyltransferase [Candidatus Bathyarchaeota archaeon]